MAFTKLDPHEIRLFKECASRIYITDSAREMKQYVQHADISTYKHCMTVALMSLYLAKRLRIHVDEEDLVVGALLHDYYLYDWHGHKDRLHGFHHPAIAAENAVRDFGVNDNVRQIIACHMWPLTFLHIPRSKEAWVVCMADKIISTRESVAWKVQMPRRWWTKRKAEKEN